MTQIQSRRAITKGHRDSFCAVLVQRVSMLSQTVEYALRAMVFLASRAPGNCTTDQIARVTRVPKAYLSKVLQGLVHAGLVVSQRGMGGGMTLARPARDLTLLDVVNKVDPIARLGTCAVGNLDQDAPLCALQRRMDEALEQLELSLAETSLESLLG